MTKAEMRGFYVLFRWREDSIWATTFHLLFRLPESSFGDQYPIIKLQCLQNVLVECISTFQNLRLGSELTTATIVTSSQSDCIAFDAQRVSSRALLW